LNRLYSWKWIKALITNQIPAEDIKKGYPINTLLKTNPTNCYSCDFAFINALGEVFPCCYCYWFNKDSKSRFNLGNINDSSFKEIWFGTAYSKFRKESNPIDKTNIPKPCGACERYFNFKEIDKQLNR
jgi:radical SAM protein with 4Fe4S-binding SPASM domain